MEERKKSERSISRQQKTTERIVNGDRYPLADGAEFELDWKNTHSFINGWRFLEDGDGWMGIGLGFNDC